MARPFLTVQTLPAPDARTRLIRAVRGAARRILKPHAPLPPTSPYPGHYAVTRSVVEGLRAIGADFNFNPGRLSDVARVVYAPANEALWQAIARKRAGEIDYLVAGPVNALFADEADGILLRPEIDRLIVAHQWQADFVRDFPDVYAKCRPCPCGVDAAWWQPPAQRPASNTAVVYWKSGPEAFCEQVEAIVRACGLEPRRVRSMHGEHAIFTAADYRRLLGESAIGVFLSTFETQGLALAEAWSMDVPTLVWDPQDTAQWRGRTFHSASSAPYLTPATGRTWRALEELEPLLRASLAGRAAFQPREWILSNMTDAICARALYALIRDGAAGRG